MSWIILSITPPILINLFLPIITVIHSNTNNPNNNSNKISNWTW